MTDFKTVVPVTVVILYPLFTKIALTEDYEISHTYSLLVSRPGFARVKQFSFLINKTGINLDWG